MELATRSNPRDPLDCVDELEHYLNQNLPTPAILQTTLKCYSSASETKAYRVVFHSIGFGNCS